VAGAFGRNVKKIRGLNLSGTAWATSACRRTTLLYSCLDKDRYNSVFIAFKSTLVKLKSKYSGCIGSVNLIAFIISAWYKIRKIFEIFNFSSFGFNFILNNDTSSSSVCSRKEHI